MARINEETILKRLKRTRIVFWIIFAVVIMSSITLFPTIKVNEMYSGVIFSLMIGIFFIISYFQVNKYKIDTGMYYLDPDAIFRGKAAITRKTIDLIFGILFIILSIALYFFIKNILLNN